MKRCGKLTPNDVFKLSLFYTMQKADKLPLPLAEFFLIISCSIDDLSAALIQLMKDYDDPELINIGTGIEISIKDLAKTISEIIGYKGEVIFDTSKPDGSPRKCLDNSKLKALTAKVAPLYLLSRL